MSHRYQQSYDSGLHHANNQSYYPVGGNNYADHNDSTAFLNQRGQAQNYPPVTSGNTMAGKSGSGKWYASPWVKYGVPVLLVAAIAGGIAGGVTASKNSSDNDSTKGLSNNAAAAPAAGSTDANGNPVYTSTGAAAAPTATGSPTATCSGSDNPQYENLSGGLQVRSDHPRLFGTKAQWDCLPSLISADAYLRSWDATIMANASRYADMDPVQYTPDGGLSGSGVLDVARELQVRTKHWAYAWRMTNDSRWVDRTWRELQVASGNSTQSFGDGDTRWNPAHFLDVAEFTAAFAYSYDWMYDAWTADQRNAIMWSIINLGLRLGLRSYTDSSVGYAWWQETNGNWNNVCNGGLTVGALAVATEDPTGISAQVLSNTIANVKENGVQAVYPDGTWTETSDYWYFGNQGLSQMVSALETATGSTQGVLDANSAYNLTGLFHMYGTGFVEKFDYGDCGPNKYSATANAMLYYGNHYDIPRYSLYQRDRSDAADPLSMLWYNSNVQGDWWYNLALDHHFPNADNAWAAMRSSWTDSNGLYSAIKAGDLTGHQAHGNLDAGTFVIEALGQRWAGELCHDNYLAPGYFASEAQDAQRWTYYRCMTEGQNVIALGGQNQLVNHAPPTTYGTTGDQQTALNSGVDGNSAAFFWTDLTSVYSGASAVRRGMRLYNQRRQVLVQDEIRGASVAGQWRMHTNATISYSNNNRTASLSLGGATLTATILDTAPDARFATLPARRTADAPALQGGSSDLPNPGVSVLAVDFPAGDTDLQILFNPQWDGLSASDYKTPTNVALSSWSVTSHNN